MAGAERAGEIYAGRVRPTIEDVPIGQDGLPHTADGIITTIESHWLSPADGVNPIERHVDNGVLELRRETTSVSVCAQTTEGVACPIVWGVSIEGETAEQDIIEPHVLVPDGKEVVIQVQSGLTRNAILGVFDEESAQPGMPPTRTPLYEDGGQVDYYVGRPDGSNEVVFWEGRKWGYLRAVTPVKQAGGELAGIEPGAAETALHGGLYLIVIPEKCLSIAGAAGQLDYLLQTMRIRNRGKGGGGDGGFFEAPLRMDDSRDLEFPDEGRPGGLVTGDIVAEGGETSFSPDVESIVPFLLRIRVVGDDPSYLKAAGVARTEQTIHVKGALCAFCGMNAPTNAYTWEGHTFTPCDFDCTHCGGHLLEPINYRRRNGKRN